MTMIVPDRSKGTFMQDFPPGIGIQILKDLVTGLAAMNMLLIGIMVKKGILTQEEAKLLLAAAEESKQQDVSPREVVQWTKDRLIGP